MFVFFHIPKAAGTTIRELISEQLRPAKSLHIDDVSRVAYQSDQWLNAHDFISGHFGAAIIPRLRPGTKKFTMLRDPVSRVKSQFRYLEYLASMDVAFNGYKTLLRGRDLAAILKDKSDPFINSLFRDTETWSLTSDYQHHYRNYEIDQSQVLSTAKNNLEAMDCFGIVEDMGGSLRLLNARFGFRIDLARAEYVRENESRGPAVASTEECLLDELIRENNPLDVELYRWAREKFDKEVLNCSPVSNSANVVLTEKPEIDLSLYSLDGSDFPSHLTYALLSERVQAAEKVNSELALRTMELQDWAEQAQRFLKSEREKVAETRSWALQSDAALAAEQTMSAQMRLWAERAEARAKAEQQYAKELRLWAERSDRALAVEREVTQQLRAVMNSRWKLFLRLIRLNNTHD